MKVLIACEYSGTVRDAFIKKGHDAISCDLLPTDIPGPHYQGDIKDMLSQNWDLIIAHPPCTYLSNSGVRWLYPNKIGTNPARWSYLVDAMSFFNMFNDHNCEKIAIENPIPHKYGRDGFGLAKGIGKYSQTIQPYQFGHLESKRTCLWLKGLPPLSETNNVFDEMMLLPYSERAKIHYASPVPDRWKTRSKTYQGIADAMADQWG
jgi:hypothetical protein